MGIRIVGRKNEIFIYILKYVLMKKTRIILVRTLFKYLLLTCDILLKNLLFKIKLQIYI